jgi:hypothetical protein
VQTYDVSRLPQTLHLSLAIHSRARLLLFAVRLILKGNEQPCMFHSREIDRLDRTHSSHNSPRGGIITTEMSKGTKRTVVVATQSSPHHCLLCCPRGLLPSPQRSGYPHKKNRKKCLLDFIIGRTRKTSCSLQPENPEKVRSSWCFLFEGFLI